MDRDIIEKNMEQGKPAPDPVELLRRIRAYYKTILQKAAETIDRLGRDTQDCKSRARLSLCNAYRNEEGEPLKSCDYKWQYADIAEKIYNPEE